MFSLKPSVMNQAHRNPALSEYRKAKKFIIECPPPRHDEILLFAQSFLSSHFSSESLAVGNSALGSAGLPASAHERSVCAAHWGALASPHNPSAAAVSCPLQSSTSTSALASGSSALGRAPGSAGLLALPGPHTNSSANHEQGEVGAGSAAPSSQRFLHPGKPLSNCCKTLAPKM